MALRGTVSTSLVRPVFCSGGQIHTELELIARAITLNELADGLYGTTHAIDACLMRELANCDESGAMMHGVHPSAIEDVLLPC